MAEEEAEQIPPPLAHASPQGTPPPPARGKLMRVTAHPFGSGSPPFAVSAPVLPAGLRHVPQARRQGGAPLPRPPKRAYVAQLVACATRAPCKLCAASLALRRASFRASHAPPALVRPGACVALNAPPAVRAYAAPPAAVRRAPQAVQEACCVLWLWAALCRVNFMLHHVATRNPKGELPCKPT